MQRDQKNHDRFQLERLAFFSDAVFAIAITLLVIDLRLPHLHEFSDKALLDALASLLPQYAGFFVSFFVIGRFWIGHHRLIGLIDRVDEKFVWQNLQFLLTIAFMPFPTAVIGEYAQLRAGMGFYSLWLVFVGWQNRQLIRQASVHLASAENAADLRKMHKNALVPIAVGLLAFATGMVQPILALLPLIATPLILRVAARFGSPR